MVKNRLKEILKARGIKQDWLAEQIGVNRSTVSVLINNKYNTSLEIAFKIAKILKLDINDIFWIED